MAQGACGGEATLTLSMSLRASSERARRCAICCETCAKRARGREFCSSAHVLFLLPAFQIRTRVRRPARANMVTRGGEEVGSPARWRKSRAERSSLHRVVCHVRGLIGSVRPRHDSPGLATRRTLAREGCCCCSATRLHATQTTLLALGIPLGTPIPLCNACSTSSSTSFRSLLD